MYEYADTTKIELGDRVVIAEDRPAGFAQETEFVVVAINAEEDAPGKLIGVEAPSASPFLHSCDGATDEQRGWWTRPENIARAGITVE